jgi:hypothetical protein
MNLEPDFLAQNGDCESSAAMFAWFKKQRENAEAKGATHHRYSVHPEQRSLILYEGWREPPWNDDGLLMEGAPRWQISAVSPTQREDQK